MRYQNALMAALVIAALFAAFSTTVKADDGAQALSSAAPPAMIQHIRGECSGRNFNRSRRYDESARYPDGPCDPYPPVPSRRDRDDWEYRRDSRDKHFSDFRRRDRRDIDARDERRSFLRGDEYCGSGCWYRRLKDGYCGHGCDYYVHRKR